MGVLCAGVGALCAGVGVLFVLLWECWCRSAVLMWECCVLVWECCLLVWECCVLVWECCVLVWECCVRLLVCYMLCVPTLCCSSLYADLLGSQQRAHIRKFAAESFAYLMRKVRLVCNHLHKNDVGELALCGAVHIAVCGAVRMCSGVCSEWCV